MKREGRLVATARAVLVLFGTCAVVLGAAGPAHAVKYNVVAKNHPDYHYGTSGYVRVNSSPAVAYQKVTGLVSFRSDWTSIAEIGHYWTGGGSRRAFLAYTDGGVLRQEDLGPVGAGTTQRYHTGYADGDGNQYFWMNGTIVAKRRLSPSLTSQWPGVNVERDTPSLIEGDNLGCFSGLKYKNREWGSWSSWTGSTCEDDRDSRYKIQRFANDHVDFVFGN